jgi:hypothetical protein
MRLKQLKYFKNEDEAPELNDNIWKLVKRCQVKKPNLQLTAEGVSETISHLLTVMMQPV